MSEFAAQIAGNEPMRVLAMAACGLLTAAGILMVRRAVAGLWAWHRPRRRPRLRLVRGAAATPRPTRSHGHMRPLSRRRRRIEVSYLRCIDGGSHVASGSSPVSISANGGG